MTKVYSSSVGTYTDITKFSVYNNGVWKEADQVYWKDAGTWKLIYDQGPYLSLSTINVLGFGFANAIPSETASASANFDSNGIFYGFGTYEGLQEFRFAPTSKTPNLYIRYTPQVPPSSPSIFSGTTNTWEQLNVGRSWALTLPNAFNFGSYFSIGLIEIKLNDVIVASGDLELSITQESGF